jgi:hypothetical protein
MRKISVLLGVLLVALAASAAAQTGSPGYYPIEKMGIFAEGDLEVNVDLSGAMMQVAAGAVENQDEALADLVANLERVRVQVGEPSSVDAAGVSRRMADAKAQLESAGWKNIISVEESTEQIYFYALERDGRISGLTGFVNEAAEEVVVINIVGDLDPRALGRVLSHLGGIDLSELMAAIEEPTE